MSKSSDERIQRHKQIQQNAVEARAQEQQRVAEQQPVGWVERSETHHVGGSILERQWVSLRSTHPTLAQQRGRANRSIMRSTTADSLG
jgi:hypothetical protein